MKEVYTIRTTSGGEKEYTIVEMRDIAKKYLAQCGKSDPSFEEIDATVEDFTSRFKFVDNNVKSEE